MHSEIKVGSSFFGLSTAVSGLYVNKKALDTVGHNIANLNTKGYTRQNVNHGDNNYSTLASNQLGNGAYIQEIRQIRDQFLDVKFREQTEQSGYYSARDSVFMQVQDIMNEFTDQGIQKSMNEFWNKWDELAKNPENLTNRAMVKASALALIENVNNTSSQLESLQRNLNKNIEKTVTRVNEISNELRDLNEKIINEESKYNSANDYRDARNLLLDELSYLVPTEISETYNGAVNVTIGGKHLVNGVNNTELIALQNKSTYVDVCWNEFDNPFENEKLNLDKSSKKQGYLKGLMDARGNIDSTIAGKGNGSINNTTKTRFAWNAADVTADQALKMQGFSNGMTNKLGDLDLSNTSSTDNAITFTNMDDLMAYVSKNGSFADGEGHQKIILMAKNDITLNSHPLIKHDELTRLKEAGVSISIITDKANKGWADVAQATGGEVFDIEKINEGNFFENLALETSSSAAREMSTIKDYTEVLPSIKQKLNAFINTIAREVNYLHKQGYDLEGNTGADFFVKLNGELPLQAGNIGINPIFNEENGHNKIAAASALEEKGNGKIAERILGLRERQMFGNSNAETYYRGIISEMGIQASNAAGFKSNFAHLEIDADKKRQSISGVSLDEEMSMMMKYQHSFAANSRVVNAIDEMLNKLINGTGRVGI